MAQATRDVVGDVLERLGTLTPGQLRRLMRDLPLKYRRELIERWQGWAQAGQCEPPGDWRIWMIRAGRGFGKTRAGAEWISEWARMLPEARIALVAANDADGRRVMIEGPSGLLAVARSDETPRWREGLRELHFSSGTVATLYSAAAAENLRGPEHHVAWCDELAKWSHGEAAWDNLVMGLRLGYLQLVARAFVAIGAGAGLPLKFQVGEPWWWIASGGRICAYDAATTTALGSASVAISDVRGTLSAPQLAMLDALGALLAGSTAALVAAARDEAGSWAGTAGLVSHLLVYLPTVLDPAAPAARRANVPLGWASPRGWFGGCDDWLDKAQPRRHGVARPCRPAAGRESRGVAHRRGAARSGNRAVGKCIPDIEYRCRRTGGAAAGLHRRNSASG